MPASFSSLVNGPSPCYEADPRRGQVAEWFKAAVLKTAVGGSLPWVRIPPCPPSLPQDMLIDRVHPQAAVAAGTGFGAFSIAITKPASDTTPTPTPTMASDRASFASPPRN